MSRTATQPKARERDATGSSWLAALIGLVFLIAAGFGVGMVAGVVWEDPGLIFAYVTGETEDVAWDDSADAAMDVAARGSKAEPLVDPQLRRTAAVESAASEAAAASPPSPPVEPARPAPPPVAAAPAGKVAVQVGAFETSEAAERLAKSLEGDGFPVYVSPGTKAGRARWRVRVGPLATREEAESIAARLKKSQKLPTWILNEDAS